MSRPAGDWPRSSSRLAALIGSPVGHSLSPALHNAAFAALGLDWAYLVFDVEEGAVEAAVAGARALGFVGLSVTMPHKEAVARAADRRSQVVERLGAANTVVFRDGLVSAESTDGGGLLDDLADACGFSPKGQVCAVVGAGGAARAVVLALADAGAAEVFVVNRSAERGRRAADLAGPVGRLVSPSELAGAALIVQATPVGMAGTASVASAGLIDPAVLGPGQLVVDLVYHPPVTPLLAVAAAAGAATRGGLGMLVRQAARQVELWSGLRAPLEAMWQAVGGDVPSVAPGLS